MSDSEYSVIKSDVIKSFDCTGQLTSPSQPLMAWSTYLPFPAFDSIGQLTSPSQPLIVLANLPPHSQPLIVLVNLPPLPSL